MKGIIRSLAVFTSVLALLLALGSTALADTASPATLSVDTGSHQVTAAAGVFTSGELIDLWYNLPDGSAAPFVTGATGMVSAGVDGSLSATIASDDWNAIPANATSIVAHGVASGVNAVFVFNRTAPSQPAVQGPATLSVDTTAHTVAAAAGTFAASEPLDLWYNLPDGSAAPFVTSATGSVVAGADGSLSATIASDDWNAIPLTATSIVAHGASSGVNAVYVFTR